MTSSLVNGKARNGLTFRPVSPEPLTKDACVTKVMCVCACFSSYFECLVVYDLTSIYRNR